MNSLILLIIFVLCVGNLVNAQQPTPNSIPVPVSKLYPGATRISKIDANKFAELSSAVYDNKCGEVAPFTSTAHFPVDRHGLGFCIYTWTDAVKNTKEAVIAIRGTTGWMNVLTDLLYAFTPHVINTYDAAVVKSQDYILKLYSDGYTITFTGHSLGAAIAELLGCRYASQVYAFDNPGTYQIFYSIPRTNAQSVPKNVLLENVALYDEKCANNIQHGYRPEDNMFTYLSTANAVNTLYPQISNKVFDIKSKISNHLYFFGGLDLLVRTVFLIIVGFGVEHYIWNRNIVVFGLCSAWRRGTTLKYFRVEGLELISFLLFCFFIMLVGLDVILQLGLYLGKLIITGEYILPEYTFWYATLTYMNMVPYNIFYDVIIYILCIYFSLLKFGKQSQKMFRKVKRFIRADGPARPRTPNTPNTPVNQPPVAAPAPRRGKLILDRLFQRRRRNVVVLPQLSFWEKLKNKAKNLMDSVVDMYVNNAIVLSDMGKFGLHIALLLFFISPYLLHGFNIYANHTIDNFTSLNLLKESKPVTDVRPTFYIHNINEPAFWWRFSLLISFIISFYVHIFVYCKQRLTHQD